MYSNDRSDYVEVRVSVTGTASNTTDALRLVSEAGERAFGTGVDCRVGQIRMTPSLTTYEGNISAWDVECEIVGKVPLS